MSFALACRPHPSLHTAALRLALGLSCLAACSKTSDSASSTICSPACPTGTHCIETGCVADAPPPDLATPPLDGGAGGCSPACGGTTPVCNASGQCVACAVDKDCPAGQRCRAAGSITACVLGCTDDSRCAGVGPGVQRCCGGACTDVNTDPGNCGSCGGACAAAHATPACAAGACVPGACTAPWADCNKDPIDGCETNLHADAASCGACGAACAPKNGRGACSDSCYIASCDFGFDDCNGDVADGCETSVLSDAKHCGSCGNSCPRPPHAAATCQNAACRLTTCDPGFADCNGDPRDGCETNIFVDKSNCGACGNTCGNQQVCQNGACTCQQCIIANARTRCVNLVCTFDSCLPGFGDCNMDLKDGCETDLNVSSMNCGACGMACPNNLPHCVMGVCSLQPQLVGHYNCSDGPQWGNNPPTYTCQEACAKVFGGNAVDYSCSTQQGMIDHMANTSIWGIGGCQVANEDYKKNNFYNCGGANCSQSAYVTDNCVPGLNYCFK